MSKIKINNTQSETLTIEHQDNAGAMTVYGNQLTNSAYRVADVDAMRLLTISPETIWVSDGRYGSHIFKKVASGTDNGGTIIATVNAAYELQYEGAVNVKWFGAVGDGVTDDTVAIQAAINNYRSVYLPYGNYLISSPLVISSSYSSITGDKKLPQIKVTETAGTGIKVIANGSVLNEFSQIKNLKLYYDGIPKYEGTLTANHCGIAIDGSTATVAAAVQRFKACNIRLLGFGCGVYTNSTVNTKLERIVIENYTDLTAETGFTNTNKYVGMYFDATPFTVGGISPNASIEVENCLVNGNSAPTDVTSICYFVNGQDPRDIFFTNCETSGGNYGWWLTTTDDNYNIDIHIMRPIIDAVKNIGIYIENFNKGAVTIVGGYVVKSADNIGAGIWITGSSGVSISGGTQILGIANNGVNDEGIRIQNSNYCIINGAQVQNCRYGISLQGSSHNSVVGNIVGANITTFESTPTLTEAIRVFSVSSYNSIIGNSIGGADSTYQYSIGININSDSPNNSIIGNNVNEVTVTTEYTIGTNTTTFIRELANITQVSGNTLQLKSYSGQMLYQGNDANYPHQFQDGRGNNIAGIDNSGSLVANSDKRLKTNIQNLEYGLDTLAKLQPKKFQFLNELDISENAPVRLGLIAQEVENIIPEVVDDSQDFKKLNYIALIPVIIKAIQDLSEKVRG